MADAREAFYRQVAEAAAKLVVTADDTGVLMVDAHALCTDERDVRWWSLFPADQPGQWRHPESSEAGPLSEMLRAIACTYLGDGQAPPPALTALEEEIARSAGVRITHDMDDSDRALMTGLLMIIDRLAPMGAPSGGGGGLNVPSNFTDSPTPTPTGEQAPCVCAQRSDPGEPDPDCPQHGHVAPAVGDARVLLWFCPANHRHQVEWDKDVPRCLDCGLSPRLCRTCLARHCTDTDNAVCDAFDPEPSAGPSPAGTPETDT